MIGACSGFSVVVHAVLVRRQISISAIGDSDRLDSALFNLEPRDSDQ